MVSEESSTVDNGPFRGNCPGWFHCGWGTALLTHFFARDIADLHNTLVGIDMVKMVGICGVYKTSELER